MPQTESVWEGQSSSVVESHKVLPSTYEIVVSNKKGMVFSSALQVEAVRVLFETILSEICELRQPQAQKIEELQQRLTKIEQNFGQVPRRLKEAEQRIPDLEDKVGSFNKDILAEQKKVRCLEYKVEEMENHAR
ncbi:hypothetical protein NDU88_008780 [Pleurodeles waltl]|uniref:Uncharacterized protein n=1 Tax=Pleurodeles waltl TaxID=8319 RepID=A0AAV7RX37_PLEWA|nr:hypothetical protein NDU88_008780 [Pleurodeles waltl]